MKPCFRLQFLFLITIGFGLHSAVAQLETNLPPTVKSNIAAQIQAYFPGKNLKGIPWLDPKVDWNKFENWPDEFHFDGKRFVLKVEETGSDTIGPVISRKEARSSFIATYKDPGAKESWKGAIRPFVSWHHGRKWEASVQVDTRKVFSTQFYPSGELYAHSYDRNPGTQTDRYRREYYSKAGMLMGFLVYGRGAESRYEWRGKRVSEDEFEKLEDALRRNGK